MFQQPQQTTASPSSSSSLSATMATSTVVVERDLDAVAGVVGEEGGGGSSGGGGLLVYNPYERFSVGQQRMLLPIYKYRTHILYLVENYPTVVIIGHTGCGKTTQIPQYLFEAGWAGGNRVVACTQPRRIAATSIAARVAEEMGVTLGREVGYSIRFDDKTDKDITRVKYMTDGMLLRETMLDPLLTKYSVVMVDEAHERSIYTDVLLGLLKKIQRKRKDLRIIISSATLDAEVFKRYFNTNKNPSDPSKDSVAIMSIEGRTFPVDILYLQTPTSDYVQKTVDTTIELHKHQPPGDVLIFLTGQEEIEKTVSLLIERASQLFNNNQSRFLRMSVLPLYAGLSMEHQQKVFLPAPRNTRKVIVATNVAETSVTIDGIVYVIDCGFVKMRAYNPRTGIDSLLIVPISQSSARQRAGRAGRNRPGKCYRLYPESAYNSLMPAPIPEIQRSNMVVVLLQLKALGIDDIVHFDFISPPPAESIIRSLEILYALGAIDGDCKLTPTIGATMAEFPVDPLIGKMLLSSAELKCSEEILTIAALLQVQSVFLQKDTKATDKAKRRFAVEEGDHITMLNVYNAFIAKKQDPSWCHAFFVNHKALQRVTEIRNQIKRYMRRFKIPLASCKGDTVAIRKSIVSGYFANAAQLQPDGTYKTIKEGRTIHIHPSSVLFQVMPEWVIYHEIVCTSKEYMREVTAVDPIWLYEAAPHYYTYMKPKSNGTG